jgi:hypothetical protein
MARAAARLALMVAVVLSLSGMTRGLCFMPGTGEAGPRDAHACCKKGWTAGAPECCMASAAGEEPARSVSGPVIAGSFGPGTVFPAPATRALRSPVAFGASDRSHSPPGLKPLRI